MPAGPAIDGIEDVRVDLLNVASVSLCLVIRDNTANQIDLIQETPCQG